MKKLFLVLILIFACTVNATNDVKLTIINLTGFQLYYHCFKNSQYVIPMQSDTVQPTESKTITLKTADQITADQIHEALADLNLNNDDFKKPEFPDAISFRFNPNKETPCFVYRAHVYEKKVILCFAIDGLRKKVTW